MDTMYNNISNFNTNSNNFYTPSSGLANTNNRTDSDSSQAQSKMDMSMPVASAEEDGLSDLERLLQEEGVDMGSVADERPDDAEGMSARDWLLLTSDDEMIRKKRTSGTKLEESEPAPKSEPESKSKSKSKAKTTESSSSSDDELSMESLLAELGIDTENLEEERPEEAEGVSARDWLLMTSDDEMIRKKLQTSTEIELDEVLDEEEFEIVEADETDDTDDFINEDELPDWLRDVDESPPPEESLSPAATLFEEAKQDSSSSSDDPMIVEEDLPDWLRDDDIGLDIDDSGSASAGDAGLPDWLQDTADTGDSPQDAQDEAPVEETTDDLDELNLETASSDGDDLPDWLQEEAGSVDEDEEDDQMVVEEDLPDWLRGDAEDGDDDDIFDFEEESPTEDLEDSDVDDITSSDEGDLPDWLREVQEESVDSSPDPITTTDGLNQDDIEDDTLADDDLPDWLQEEGIADDDSDSEEVSFEADEEDEESGVVEEAELPDWLRQVKEEDDTAETGDTLPAWLEESGDEPVEDEPVQVAEDEVPDWLQEESEDTDSDDFFADDSSEEDSFSDDFFADDSSEEDSFGDDFFADDSSKEDSFGNDIDDMPDFLNTDDADDSSPFGDTIESQPKFIAEGTSKDTESEDEIPDWLQDIEDSKDQPTMQSSPEAEPISEVEIEPHTPTAPEPSTPTETEPPKTASATPPIPPPPSITSNGDDEDDDAPEWLRKLRQGSADAGLAYGMPNLPAMAMPISAAAPIIIQQSYTASAQQAPTPPPAQQPSMEAVPYPQTTEPPSTELAPAATMPTGDASKLLRKARDQYKQGNLEDCTRYYSSVVNNNMHLSDVIKDLQDAVEQHPSRYTFYQILGDAMMRSGQLEGALNAYRQAMAKL